jgi:NedA-like, galactose-binding domain
MDGSTESIWSTSTGPEQWIQIDLVGQRSIGEIRLTIPTFLISI